MTHTPYQLTSFDITELRTEIKRRGGAFVPDGERLTAHPMVCCARSDSEFYLHSGGATVAVSRRPEVILACLYNEVLSPGWCKSALDPRRDPDEALMNPAEQALRDRNRRVLEAQQREREAEAADAARRRRTHMGGPQVSPDAIDLDYLLDPTRA